MPAPKGTSKTSTQAGVELIVELEEGYEFDGRQVSDKFVVETADRIFKRSVELCDNDPEVMLQLIEEGRFQLSNNKETGKPFTDGITGKPIYSIPRERERKDTGAARRFTNINIASAEKSDDPYKDVKVTYTVVKKQLK